MSAYYNEIDPYAAQWLRNLIAAGHIAAGVVDERSIVDVKPDELIQYTQCHFFAGIGGWSRALRIAGWPDERPVWTGSCPCQPFSAAGKGTGTNDDRHLWPAWFGLIRECRPGTIFGEQVEAAINHGWLDLVQSDLESEGYACGAVGIPAGGVGAPHIRQRLWFVANAESRGLGINGSTPRETGHVDEREPISELADSTEPGRQSRWGASSESDGRNETRLEPGRLCDAGGLADAGNGQLSEQWRRPGERDGHGSDSPNIAASPVNSQWRDADWLLCRDGKWRPVEPGTFPLASRVPARVGQLRSYGNAIVPQDAAQVIQAFMEYPG